MKAYFDRELDPYNFKTLSKDRTAMEAKEAVKWYYDSATDHAHSIMEPLKGKNVLDIGCGVGTHLVWLAKQGANVTGIDISDTRIEEARKMAEREGLSDKISVHVKGAEDTGLPENTFDIVYGQDILMFLDGEFRPFMKEMQRILKKGGSLVFSEALDAHPVARLYRKYMAPSEWKSFTRYLSVGDMDTFRGSFEKVGYETFYLTAFFVYAFKMYMPSFGLFRFIDRLFTAVDRAILKVFPGLGKYCWRIVFKATK